MSEYYRQCFQGVWKFGHFEPQIAEMHRRENGGVTCDGKKRAWEPVAALMQGACIGFDRALQTSERRADLADPVLLDGRTGLPRPRRLAAIW